MREIIEKIRAEVEADTEGKWSARTVLDVIERKLAEPKPVRRENRHYDSGGY